MLLMCVLVPVFVDVFCDEPRQTIYSKSHGILTESKITLALPKDVLVPVLAKSHFTRPAAYIPVAFQRPSARARTHSYESGESAYEYRKTRHSAKFT